MSRAEEGAGGWGRVLSIRLINHMVKEEDFKEFIHLVHLNKLVLLIQCVALLAAASHQSFGLYSIVFPRGKPTMISTKSGGSEMNTLEIMYA